MGLKAIVLDFDGTLTDVAQEADPAEVHEGRTAITELWPISEEARERIGSGSMKTEEYLPIAIASGMKPMLISDLEKELIKFIRMSKKNNQQKIIEEILKKIKKEPKHF